MDDKGKCLQVKESPTNYPHESLLFYIRDSELCYTSFCGLRYKEFAISIDFHELYLSASLPFHQYFKIILAYRSLVQDVNNHPIIII